MSDNNTPVLYSNYHPVHAAVCRNQNAKGEAYYSVTLEKKYRDDAGKWASTTSFAHTDLLLIAKVWKLTVRDDHSATVVCDDGNDNIIYTQNVEYTDFPLDEIKLYFANNVVHLPSEC
jgi:hypothetical protein